MGYTTDFTGEFGITPALKEEHQVYLEKFAESRRMKRNASIAETLEDVARIAAGLEIGVDGAFYVGGADDGNMGQNRDESVVDGNRPPASQPSLWCQWVPNEDGTAIEWDGGEKFYYYVDWIKYLIDNFLGPWGYKLNGSVEWSGEEQGDVGTIVITDNEVSYG